MDVLLTFTGFHDPYFKGLVDQEEQVGPARTDMLHHKYPAQENLVHTEFQWPYLMRIWDTDCALSGPKNRLGG